MCDTSSPVYPLNDPDITGASADREQQDSKITQLQNGNVVVVTHSWELSGSACSVKGRLFVPRTNHTLLGAPFRVKDSRPVKLFPRGSGFSMLYELPCHPTNTTTDLVLERFNSRGESQASPSVVFGEQEALVFRGADAVQLSKSKNIVVVWLVAEETNAQNFAIRMRVYSSGLIPRTEVLKVNATDFGEDGTTALPRVVPLLNGGFAVVWTQGYPQYTTLSKIWARTYDAVGKRRQPKPVRLDVDWNYPIQDMIDVEPLTSDGRFLVVWKTHRGQVVARKFSFAGIPEHHSEFLVGISPPEDRIQMKPDALSLKGYPGAVFTLAFGSNATMPNIAAKNFNPENRWSAPEYAVFNGTTVGGEIGPFFENLLMGALLNGGWIAVANRITSTSAPSRQTTLRLKRFRSTQDIQGFEIDPAPAYHGGFGRTGGTEVTPSGLFITREDGAALLFQHQESFSFNRVSKSLDRLVFLDCSVPTNKQTRDIPSRELVENWEARNGQSREHIYTSSASSVRHMPYNPSALVGSSLMLALVLSGMFLSMVSGLGSFMAGVWIPKEKERDTGKSDPVRDKVLERIDELLAKPSSELQPWFVYELEDLREELLGINQRKDVFEEFVDRLDYLEQDWIQPAGGSREFPFPSNGSSTLLSHSLGKSSLSNFCRTSNFLS
jgi:hypothetical protein